jgi:hypothetical protein
LICGETNGKRKPKTLVTSSGQEEETYNIVAAQWLP